MTIPGETRSASDIADWRFRTIFEQSPVSTQIFSPDGWTLAVNRAWEQLWGVTLAQLGRYNVLQDPQLVEKGVMPYVERGFAGEPVNIPAIKYEPDLTVLIPGAVPFRWVRAFIYPVRDELGAIREVVLMHEDITQQTVAEEALRESETRFRAMFDGAPVGIALVDSEGRYIAVNPIRQAMLGYSEAELIGKRYLEVTHPDDVELDVRVNEEARREGRDRFQIEKRFVRSTGEVIWTRITAAGVRNEAGELLYSISISEDISDRRRTEEAKDEFLSAVAHDLRTPLTTIRGRAQMLRAQAARGAVDPEALQESLRRIETNTTRMISLINELLDVANIQIGRPLAVHAQPTDLVALAHEVAAEQQQVSDLHTIVVHAESSELVGTWDRTRIERILANLLSNAVKYSPRGGQIDVRIVRESKGSGDWILLSVGDRGVGIPESDLPYVFERFHRAHNVRGAIPGTGIGLAAVKSIVEQHRGTIEVESTEGEGTTFNVRLPLDPERLESRERPRLQQ